MIKDIKNTTEESILDDKAVREGLMKRTEVLEKVKDLLLIPKLDLMPAKNVADFYEVGIEVVKKVFQAHRDELESDGMIKVNRSQALAKIGHNEEVKVETYKTHIEMIVGDATFKIANRAGWMFPRRAILRVGMLLRDSGVAKEVRTQLLNIEEKVQLPEKVMDINIELNLLGQAFTNAYINGDMNAFAEITMKLNQHKDRHKDEVIESLKERNQELESKLSTMTSNITKLTNTEVYRECAMSLVNRIRVKMKYKDNYLILRELYVILRNKYNIDLNIRAYAKNETKSKIDCIKITEWPTAMQILTSFAYRYNVDIKDILVRLERAERGID